MHLGVNLSSLTLLVTAKNEIDTFPRIVSWAERMHWRKVLVDSGSSDGTDDYAGDHHWEVAYHPYLSASAQLNWALDCINDDGWVLILDADELPLFEASQIEDLVAAATRRGLDAVAVRRKNYFGTRWIRHGGFYPDWQVRLMRTSLRYEERAVHAHVDVPRHATLFADVDLHHVTYESIDDYWVKLLRFTNRETQAGAQSSARPRWRRLRALYSRLPARAPIRFVHRYFLRLGFLDGRLGWHLALWSAVYEDIVSARKNLGAVTLPSAERSDHRT